METVIGRKKEVDELKRLYDSDQAQLVSIYGRRRVGKTYLVDTYFKKKFAFKNAGLSPIETDGMSKSDLLKAQLMQFYNSLRTYGWQQEKIPENWMEAFLYLELLLQEKDTGEKQVVFLDELPWMDTPGSRFIMAFEGFWNSWACSRDNLMVIICGSATSWIYDKLINNYGGLYGRVTYQMKLKPFTLRECEELFVSKHIPLSRYDITQAYMVTGGIPYYLNYFEPGLSLAQNVNELFFSDNCKLFDEFDRLFSSIFNRPDTIKEIIRILSRRSLGYTRNEIAEALGTKSGGTLTNALNAMRASDFVIKYVPFGYSKKQEHYKLVDPFCIFYLKFVEDKTSLDKDFWIQSAESHSVISWRGFAFENVCFNHIDNIKKALGISGVSTTQSAWCKKGTENETGAQIDLIIERSDNIVDLCEAKFYSGKYLVTKEYDSKVRNKINIFNELIRKKQAINTVLITTEGVVDNGYKWIFNNIITLDDLFE